MDAQDDDNFSIWPGAKNQNLADNYPCIQSSGGGHSSQRKVNLLCISVSPKDFSRREIWQASVFTDRREDTQCQLSSEPPFIILNLAGGWLVISDGGADKVTPTQSCIHHSDPPSWLAYIDCKWKFMFQWFISKGCWEDWLLMISRFLDRRSFSFHSSFDQSRINRRAARHE